MNVINIRTTYNSFFYCLIIKKNCVSFVGPHIGHFYSACIADCIYRYEKLRNRSSKYIFSTGTDEHGTKIQQAAKLYNRTPEEYCNQISQSYRQLFDKSNTKYTHFNRTTDKTSHLPAVHHFWVSSIK